MAPQREEDIAHLFRRAGFGASAAEITQFARLGIVSFSTALGWLLNFEAQPDDADAQIGKAGYVGINSTRFAPTSVINDARQRLLFRMVHSKRPLQEKMTLFWHNHFATAHS